MKQEQKKRSLAKAISYRILIIIATGCITWLVTKQLDITLIIASLTGVVNTILYYLHERFWNMTSWGLVKNRLKK